jgi:signal peptidase
VQHVTLEPRIEAPDIRTEMLPQDVGGPTRNGSESEAPVSRRGFWRTLKGIVSTVTGVVFGGIALLAVVIAVSTHFAADGQLGVFGHPVMTVLSGSMAPSINTGDLVVGNRLTPAQAASLSAGQVISFHPTASSPQVFTHRIVAVEVSPDGAVAYATKGDANDSQDGALIPSTNIVALYQSRIPYGGYILNALHQPMVLGLLLASPLLWLLSGALFKWARETDEPTSSTAVGRGESPA